MAVQLLNFLAVCTILGPTTVWSQTAENGGVVPQESSAPTGSPSGGGTAGGASGGNNGINISKGGLIAIILVIAVVVVIGITTAVLFYLTKKRQWELRKSFRRTARRFTSRGAAPAASGKSRPIDQRRQPAKQEIKTSVRDVEKGSPELKSSFDADPATPKTWREKLSSFGRSVTK